ncbi:MAG: hypothetical protein HUU35_20160, partial [Armatimonadetes bacterium]|nr:hypothetical protein [Armatimonadota bacterium]
EPHFPSFAEVTDRLIAYLEACGFNTLYYPAVWYHGPLYPSASQGDSQLGSRPHPSDFIRYLLGRFAARGLKLVVTFNVHDLPSLAEVETREERVRAGAPTPLSVLWNGALKTSGWHGTPGDYNPVDPAVHGAVKTLVQELAERYGDSLAFGGICFHLPRHSLLWFGQLEGGYNDLNLARFQEETGVRLELDPADPLRANRAYRQLVGRHREAWLDWRARRLAAQWSEYAGILRQRRADLKLAINLYTVLDSTREHLAEVPPEEIDYRGEAREYGADVALLAKIPGVSLMNTFSPGLYRWERSRRPPGRPSQRVYRVSDFTPSAYGPFAGLGAPFGVNLHDKYWEDDIGRTQPLKALREWGQTELGWRVSTPVPPAPYCLENYAQALGEADVTTLTKGGFVVGTVGMEEAVRSWAAAFAALPAVPFHDPPGLADPIRVRWAARSERTWLYAQNRLPEPVTLTLRLAGAKALVRLADGVSLPLREGSLTLQLTGYELVSLGGPAGVTVVGGEVSGTAPALARLRAG